MKTLEDVVQIICYVLFKITKKNTEKLEAQEARIKSLEANVAGHERDLGKTRSTTLRYAE